MSRLCCQRCYYRRDGAYTFVVNDILDGMYLCWISSYSDSLTTPQPPRPYPELHLASRSSPDHLINLQLIPVTSDTRRNLAESAESDIVRNANTSARSEYRIFHLAQDSCGMRDLVPTIADEFVDAVDGISPKHAVHLEPESVKMSSMCQYRRSELLVHINTH